MSDQPKTFELDATLPPLPVPTLQETCDRYLAGVEPLLSADEFAKTKENVEELLTPGGVGAKLQELLEVRAATSDNWLSGWWEKYAYLAYPDPIVVNSSIGISGDPENAPGHQASRAALIAHGTVQFYLGIIHETLPPERQRDGSGFDMSLLRRFLAATRVPGIKGDHLVNYAPDETGHIVVIRRGRYYKIDGLTPEGHAVDPATLRVHFERVIAAADAQDLPPAVGVLTAGERPFWSRERDRLALDPVNRRAIDLIERALFVVCLDDENHDKADALARAGLYGQKGNRWHDKSLHLIIDRQGRFTLHGEHAPVDAGAWCPLIDQIAGLSDPVVALSDTRHITHPIELTWQLWPETLQAIDHASAVYDGLTDNLDLHVRPFTDFGKDLIKTFKTGPDPVIQMAFMLAYYRRYGRLPKTYEAASTRMYKGGRTETIRTASNEALALVKAVDDPGVSAATRHELIRAAFAEHSKRGKEASAGFAVDRHLFGLKLIAAENGIDDLPALFSEEVYTRGWELSTAQVPLKHGYVNHFGPVCADGYGIGYVIKNAQINFNITSWRSSDVTDTHAFAGDIVKAMRDLRQVLEAGLAEQAA
ncbi:MAG: choline/carnitine O-acyltransferase [Pseudomonadota bacterium]